MCCVVHAQTLMSNWVPIHVDEPFTTKSSNVKHVCAHSHNCCADDDSMTTTDTS